MFHAFGVGLAHLPIFIANGVVHGLVPGGPQARNMLGQGTALVIKIREKIRLAL